MLAQMILWPALVFAQAPEAIERANEKVQQMQGPSAECPNCEASAARDTKADLLQCVSALCPNGTGYRPQITSEEMSKLLSEPPAKELFELAVKVILTETEQERISDLLLLEAMEKNVKLTNPAAAKLANIGSLLKDLSMLTYSEDGKYDEVKTRDVYISKGGNLEDFPAFSELIREIIDEQKKAPAEMSMSLQEFSAGKNSKSLRAGLNRLLDKAEAGNKKIAKLVGLPVEFTSEPEKLRAMRRRAAKDSFSEVAFESLKEAVSTNSLYLRVMSSKKFSPLEKRARYFREFAAELGSEEAIRDRIATANKLTSGDKSYDSTPYGKVIDTRAEECSAAIASGMVVSPTPRQKTEFLRNEVKMRAEFFERAKKLLSKHSSIVLAEAGAKWKLAPPANRDEFEKEFRERFQEYLAGDLHSEAKIKKLNAEQRQVMLGLAIIGAEADSEKLSAAREICKEKMPVENDHASSTLNRYHLSGMTASQPRFAKRVAFHEYAHMASNTLRGDKKISPQSAKWYRDSRRCLNDQRGEKATHEEEDFASMMAGDLAADSENHQCASPWSEADAKYLTLEDADYDNIHSGPLYLMLLEHVSSGKPMPEVCAASLAAAGQTGLPKNCSLPSAVEQ